MPTDCISSPWKEPKADAAAVVVSLSVMVDVSASFNTSLPYLPTLLPLQIVIVSCVDNDAADAG